MAIREDNSTIYTIPDNFIDESRVLKGIFKTRNFLEGLVMAGIVALFAVFIPAKELTAKITILVAICSPAFIAGIQGFNGDPISITIKNALRWRKERALILFNKTPRPLTQAPLDAMMEREDPKDKLLDYIEKVKTARAERNSEKEMVEGVDFEFEDDDNIISEAIHRPKTESDYDENSNEDILVEEANDIYIEEDLHIHDGEMVDDDTIVIQIKPDTSINLMEEELF